MHNKYDVEHTNFRSQKHLESPISVPGMLQVHKRGFRSGVFRLEFAVILSLFRGLSNQNETILAEKPTERKNTNVVEYFIRIIK